MFHCLSIQFKSITPRTKLYAIAYLRVFCQSRDLKFYSWRQITYLQTGLPWQTDIFMEYYLGHQHNNLWINTTDINALVFVFNYVPLHVSTKIIIIRRFTTKIYQSLLNIPNDTQQDAYNKESFLCYGYLHRYSIIYNMILYIFSGKTRCRNSQEGKGQTYGKLCNNIIKFSPTS
jgi:hypothetical protein